MFGRVRSLLWGPDRKTTSPPPPPATEDSVREESFPLASEYPTLDVRNDSPLGDFCIDEYKPLKVIVIGAGFSGIAAGIRYSALGFLASVWLTRGTALDSAYRISTSRYTTRMKVSEGHGSQIDTRMSVSLRSINSLSHTISSGLSCDIPSHCVRVFFFSFHPYDILTSYLPRSISTPLLRRLIGPRTMRPVPKFLHT